MIAIHTLRRIPGNPFDEFAAYFTADDLDDLQPHSEIRQVARGYLRYCLELEFEAPSESFSLVRDSNGRLAVRSAQTLDISLSHKPGVVVAAIARGCTVGVDVESSTLEEQPCSMLQQNWRISETDCDWFRDHSMNSAARWTRREAVYKLACGIWPDASRVAFPVLRERFGNNRPVVMTFPGDVYTISVASNRECACHLALEGRISPAGAGDPGPQRQ